MAKGIGINFTAESDEVIDESRKVQRALGEVEDSLGEVGDAADKSSQKQTDGLKDVERSADDTGEAVAKNAGGGFEDLAQTASDAVGGIGDDLLGLVGIAGGVGGAVGAAVGAGIDYVTGLIEEQQKAAEELKTKLIEAYKSASEEGRNYLDQAQIIALANEFMFDSKKMDEFRTKAELIGVDVNTYLLAQAGSYEDLQIVIEAARVAEERRGQVTGDRTKAGQAEAVQEALALDRVISENERLIQIHEQGKEAAENSSAIRDELAERERDQIKRTADADQARYEALAARHAEISQLPPAVLRTEVQDPDIASLLTRTQEQISRGRRIHIPVDFVDRSGNSVP